MSYDVNLRAGTSLRIDSVVTNLDGSIHDLTESTGTFKIYDAPRGELVLTGGFELDSPEDGTAFSYLDDSQTDNMIGEYHVLWYEVKLTENDGTETIIESGRLVVN